MPSLGINLVDIVVDAQLAGEAQVERRVEHPATFTQAFTWRDSNNPRHRLVSSATWEIPFGKGRSHLGSMPGVLQAIVGGWDLTGVGTWRSGRFLRFGGLVANGDPIIENPTEKAGSIPRHSRGCPTTRRDPIRGSIQG